MDQPLSWPNEQDGPCVRFVPPEKELLMLLIRKHHQADAAQVSGAASDVAPSLAQPGPPVVRLAPTLAQTVRDLHAAGHSQRSIARDLGVNRRKVKQILDREAT